MFAAALVATALSLPCAAEAPQQPPIRTLLVSGANNPDWEWTAPEIARALTETGRFEVAITYEPAKALAEAPALAAAGKLQLIVLDYNGPRWGEAAEQG
ncbi:MAG: hypothetical protein ACK5BN_04430, partial [Planctomycetota bacterium]